MAPPDLRQSPTSASSAGSPAGYGRSCTNCARTKCKCILTASGASCERCHRLGKDCQPIAATRKRTAKKGVSLRKAQLEEKLDDLVSILRSSQGPVHHPRVTASSSQPASETLNQQSRLDSLATAATATSPHPGYPSNTNFNTNINESGENSEPTPAEADLYLQKFRGWLRNFPFMYIPPDMTAATLRREKPFLWLCIMNITSMSVPQMQIMRDRVRQDLAHTLIVKHEPSLDIALGLIAYLGWATMNSAPGWKPFLVLFAQMAASVTYELGLTRSPAEEQYFATCFRAWGGRQPQPKLRTLEERRALVSLWFLTSIISSFIGKMDCIRWTSHMEESLEILEREKEYGQDETLTTLIRFQLVADEAHKLLVQDIMRGEAAQTPSFIYRKSMLNRLRSIRDNMSHSVGSNCVVQAHGHATEVLIHSMGLFMPSIPDNQRIDALYSCLRATHAWYDIWFSVPLGEVPGLPFSIYIQLSQTQVALYRLTTNQDPAWDKNVLRSTADLLLILDRTIERFESMATVYPMKVGSDGASVSLYTKVTKILRNIKASWEPALAQNLGGMPTPNSQESTAASVAAAASGGAGLSAGRDVAMGGATTNLAPADANTALPDPEAVDFADWWMTDVFGPWGF